MRSSASADKMIADIRNYLNNNNIDQARTIAQQAVAEFPQNVDLLFLSGHIALKAGDYTRAIPRLKKCAEKAPYSAEVKLNLGLGYQYVGQLEEACDCYLSACQLDPELVQAYANLGFCLRARGNLDEALQAFYKAIQLDRHHVGAAQGLSTILGRALSPNYTPVIADMLVEVFNSPYVEYGMLAPATVCQLTHLFGIKQTGATTQQFDAENDLLVNYLTKCINIDPAMEFALTAARRALVISATPDLRLTELLAIQCFANEYVFAQKEEERVRVQELKTGLEKTLEGSSRDNEFWRDLKLFAMYAPLFELEGGEKLLEEKPGTPSEKLSLLMKLTLADYVEEQSIREEIKSFSPIKNATSKKVRQQYEANPYPRWTHVPAQIKAHPVALLKAMFPHFSPPSFLKPDMRILIAGSGTGQHVAQVALKYPQAQVLTFDLSKSSLAYARRMIARLGISNVEFCHGDILHAAKLEGGFDIIESIGVLHHMKQPIEGWRVLVGLLRDGGMFRAGLYSRRGRQGVFAARDAIAREGIGDSAAEIVAFRQRVFLDPPDGNFKRIKERVDFYTTSNCRDLLFHVHEDNYTPKRLHEEITALGLDFVGFEEYEELGLNNAYQAMFADDVSLTNLLNWEEFEKSQVETPEGYVFWCQKPIPAFG